MVITLSSYKEILIIILCKIVDCGVPISSNNGSFGSYTNTREGTSVIFECDEGFRPSAPMVTTCMRNAMWYPPPQDQDCILVVGMLVYKLSEICKT